MSTELDKLFANALQARREHRPSEARRDLGEAVNICRASGEPGDLARALTGLGQIERDLSHPEAALQLYEEAVAIYRTQGEPLKLAHTVRHMGDILQAMKRWQLAEPCYDEALKIYRGHTKTTPLDLANTVRGLALLKSNAGQVAAATALWTEARELYAACKIEAGVAESSRQLALLAQHGTQG